MSLDRLPGTEPSDTWLCGVSAACAAVALGQAIHVDDGQMHAFAIILLAFVLACASIPLALPTNAKVERQARGSLKWILGLSVFVQIIQVVISDPVRTVARENGIGLLYITGFFVAALAGTTLVRRGDRYCFPLMLAGVAVLGALVISFPNRKLDSYVFQVEAVDALLKGINPFGITMPDVHRVPGLYGPDMVFRDRLLYGFVYPPLTLVFDIAGKLLAGDVRAAHLASLVASAGLIGYSRPGIISKLAALLFLFTPRGLLVVATGWTEPFVAFTLALVVFVMCRFKLLSPWLFGMFLAIKQYTFLGIPAALMLLPRPISRQTIRKNLLIWTAVPLALALPFLIWNWTALVRSTLEIHFGQPFRDDALSFAVVFARTGWLPKSSLYGFAAAFLAILLTTRKPPKTPAEFSFSTACVFLFFFAFGQQAFCNYYFFVIGAISCALGALSPVDHRNTAVAPADTTV